MSELELQKQTREGRRIVLEPGHPILNPEGKEIKLPAFAFKMLRKLHVISRDPESGRLQIKREIYDFLRPEFESLIDGLRQILGDDCSGPKIPFCDCSTCRPEDTGWADTNELLIGRSGEKLVGKPNST